MTAPHTGRTAFPSTGSAALDAFHQSQARTEQVSAPEQPRPWYTDPSRIGSHEQGPVPGYGATPDLAESMPRPEAAQYGAPAPQNSSEPPTAGNFRQRARTYLDSNRSFVHAIALLLAATMLYLVGFGLGNSAGYDRGNAAGYHQGSVDASASVGKQLMDDRNQMQTMQRQLQDMQQQLANPVSSENVYACSVSHTDYGPTGQAGLYVTRESGRTEFIPNKKIGYPGIYAGTTFIETTDSNGLVFAKPVPGQMQSFSGCDNVNMPFPK